jgi:cytochrome P450
MTAAADLQLPDFDPADVTLHGDRFHEVVAQLAAQSWLARIPLGYLTLDRDAGEFFLRSRKTAFPGRQIAEFFGVTSGPLAEHIDANILNLDGERHRRLRALVPAAVEEVLRFEPVTPFTARICLEQVEHRDVVFPAGTIVAVCAERANRQGEDGEAFGITAPRESRLLTFGAGTHYCLGANLARAELEEALAFPAPRTPGLALDGPPQLGGVEGIYGVDKLPITWSGSSAMSPNHGSAPDVS